MSKITDPIADYLTRLRNAQKAKHRVVLSLPPISRKRLQNSERYRIYPEL
jgi:ribosomal protein S8